MIENKTVNCAIISDLHIKNNSRTKEYVHYFEELRKELSELNLDFIFFCGDLLHSKSVLSPDSVLLAKTFLHLLRKISKKVVVILGNHDCVEKNVEKLDSISPIVANDKELQEIIFMRNSEIIKIENNLSNSTFMISSFSILDKQNWQNIIDENSKEENEDYIKIGLYHGPLSGAKTDLGFVFSNTDSVEKYNCLDFMFCGDIHSYFSYKNDHSKVSVGNPIQQDFSENLVKGFLYYKIHNDKTFEHSFIQLKNLYPYLTLNVGDDIPELEDSNKIRVRIFSNQDLDTTKEYIKNVKNKYKEKIHSLSSSRLIKNSTIENKKDKILSYDEYISEHPDKDNLKKIYENYENSLQNKTTNNNWKILDIKWNNLFSYAENNHIELSKYENSILGLFGQNYSGKTSIIDVICFSIFGSWTKPFVKSINFINDTKQYADCEVLLEINGEKYSIYRKIERTGNTSKSTLNFQNITKNENLNCDSVTDTQNLIEKYVGSKEHFFLSSLSTQYNNFSLIDEKNTKRKEYFSLFLGIDKYNEIYKLASKELDLKYKHLEWLQNSQGKIDTILKNLEQIKTELSKIKSQEFEAKLSINSIKKISGNPDKYLLEISNLQREIVYINNNIEKLRSINDTIEVINFDDEIDDKISNLTKKIYDEKLKISELQFDKLKTVENNIKNIEAKIQKLNVDKNLLDLVPCGKMFPTCKFISNSITEVEKEDEYKTSLDGLCNMKKIILENIEFQSKLLIDSENKLAQMKEIKSKQDKCKKEIIEKNNRKNIIKELQEDLQNKKDKYDLLKTNILLNYADVIKSRQVDIIKLLEGLIVEKNEQIRVINSSTKDLEILEEKRKNITESIKSCEKIINTYNEYTNEISILEEFCKTVGKNGISVKILKDYVPIISSLMNEIISEFMEMEVDICIEQDKYLEIYVKDGQSTRLIESCSGSQKTIVSYALRMALLHFSQISCSNLFILDEPATSFDESHLLDFGKLLQKIKMDNKTILLVTHIQSLKDSVDTNFIVDRTTGYSRILI